MRWSVPALCLCIGALAGCGDGDGGQPSRAVTVTGSAPIAVVAKEYAFDPGRIVVAGGGPELRVTLDNRGSLAHDLRIVAGGRDLGGLRSFPAGEKRTATVRVPPGRYRIVCTVADHEELGMIGRLEVRG